MSAEAAVLTRSWPVGQRTVTLSVPKLEPGRVMSLVAEWAPTEPTRLSTEEWREYRFGRNNALTELAAELGINVAVLDL